MDYLKIISIFLFIFLFVHNSVCILNTKSQSKVSSSTSRKQQQLQWFGNNHCYVDFSCDDTVGENVCFGSKISYSSASLSPNENSVRTKSLSSFNALFGDFSGLPECWTLLRELLCSIQFASCHQNKLKLASRDLCEKTMKKCPFLVDNNLWPEDIGDCSNPKIFTNSCPINTIETKVTWNISSKTCVFPLVVSKFELGWYLPHCALNCTSHWLVESEHDHLNHFISTFGIIILVVTIFTLVTLLLTKSSLFQKVQLTSITLHASTKHTVRPLRMYLVCNILMIFFWLLQPLFDLKQLSCRDDGSLRQFEPAREQNFACTAQFVGIYLGLVGSSYWLAIFSYYIYMSYTMCEEKVGLRVKKLGEWLQLGWSIPFGLLVYPLASAKVEADGISGICFIGYSESLLMVCLVHVPVAIFYFAAFGIFILSVCKRTKRWCSDNSPNSIKLLKKLNDDYPTRKLVFFWLFQFVSLMLFLIVQLTSVNSFVEEIRNHSFAAFIQCQIRNPSDSECKLENRPDIRLVELQISTFFFFVLLTDFWLLMPFGGNLLMTWKFLLIKIFEVCRNTSQLSKDDRGSLAGNCEKPLEMTCSKTSLASSVSDSSQSTSNKRAKVETSKLSSKEFARRMNSRTSFHRGSFTRTASSLRSGSLPTNFYGSTAELPFFEERSKTPKLPPYFPQPYPHWFPPWQMFYPFSPVMPAPGFQPPPQHQVSISQQPSPPTVVNGDSATKQCETTPISTIDPRNYYFCPPTNQNPWMNIYPPPWMAAFYQQYQQSETVRPKSDQKKENNTESAANADVAEEASNVNPTRAACNEEQLLDNLTTTGTDDFNSESDACSSDNAAHRNDNDDDDECENSSEYDSEEAELVEKQLREFSFRVEGK